MLQAEKEKIKKDKAKEFHTAKVSCHGTMLCSLYEVIRAWASLGNTVSTFPQSCTLLHDLFITSCKV